jgi:hypothetical protein
MSFRSNTAKTAAIAILAAAAAALLVMLLFPRTGTTAAVSSPVVRLAAQFDMFNGEEFNTTAEPDDNAAGGQAIYDTIVTPPANANVLYVTVSGTGDAHENSKIMLACLVQSLPCNPGDGNADGVTGWVTLQYPTDDLHDNNINYTWCKRITPGTNPRHVTVKMASENGGDVYMETTHFFVDASQLGPHACDQALTPEGAGGGDAPAGAGHGG